MLTPTRALSIRQVGTTLIELVVSIVVLSIAVVGVLTALGGLVSTTADPMIREQSISIAQAYLEEISLSQFAPTTSCPVVPGVGGRANFYAVCHYNGLSDIGAVDQNGNSIASLSNYDVQVSVTNSSNLGGLASAAVLRIDVSVTGPTNETFSISSYRTDY